MLRRFTIRGFKSLESAELELPRLAVFAGPNAAGKSNILDAIQLLARVGTQRTLAEAFAPPIRGFPTEAFTLPAGGLRELLAQSKATLDLEADLEIPAERLDGPPERVRYKVSIEIDPDAGALTVAGEYLTALDRHWEPKGKARIEREGDHLTLRRARGSGRPQNEVRGLGHTLLSDARHSGPSYPLFDLVRRELRQWRAYYLDPLTAMRAAQPPREVPDIGVHGENLAPFLYGLKTRHPKAFEAVRRSLRSAVPAIGGLDVDLDTKRGTLDIQIEQDGTLFSSRIVSEGTLRVLALCAIAVTASGGIVAFEEPENGVQPQRLDRIAELLTSAGRRGSAQIVLTTHSPDFIAAMLERARPEGDEVGLFGVARAGRTTTIRPIPDPGVWTEPALNELLGEPDDHDKIAALARRGWLDL
ncbi:MAG TPA: AAA family ATPase [Solirubrobacteraceae bacterium]|jgi:predicted ATPase|nr:AAA family ATPase [Solirubrobacteraceae bacterium]